MMSTAGALKSSAIMPCDISLRVAVEFCVINSNASLPRSPHLCGGIHPRSRYR